MIDPKLLIKNGVQFGHQTSRLCPKMLPFIWGKKNKIHLINVQQTAYQMEKASKFLESIAAEGKSILLVGTKKAAQNIVLKLAKELNLTYVARRWVGGTFSNNRQVRKSVANLLHYDEILSKSNEHSYLKKELNVISKRAERLDKIVGGIRNLSWPVGAVVVIDVKKEHVCVKEAVCMKIPVVGIVDTNSDPSGVDFVIPANDDAPRSIDLIMNYLSEGIKKGQALAGEKPKEQVTEPTEILENVLVLPPEEDEEEKAAKAKKARGKVPETPTTPVPTKKVFKPKAKTEEVAVEEAKPTRTKVKERPVKTESKPKAEPKNKVEPKAKVDKKDTKQTKSAKEETSASE